MESASEFDLHFKYRFEGSVNLEVDISRSEIPLICWAFDMAMSERLGASFYYPRLPEGSTRCRYEWFLRYQKEPHGIRISTFFDVGDEDLRELPFLISWGPKFLSNIGTLFDKVAQKRIVKEVESVWKDVNIVVREEPSAIWSFLSHIDLPPGRSIADTVTSELITVYSAMKHKREEIVLSAVAAHLPAHSRFQAVDTGLSVLDKFIALLSLLAGTSIERTRVRWPKAFKYRNTFEGRNIPKGRLYSMTSCAPAPESYQDLTEMVRIAVNLMEQASVMDDRSLWDSINAYAAGQEVMKRQPTLSSVAFIASLAAFSKGTKCKGDVTCSRCGVLKNFRHDLIGERAAIVQTVKETLPIELSDKEAESLDDLIKAVHSKQRSAFVHDAILRHAELDKQYLRLGRPGEARIIPSELEYMEDLYSIWEIARKTLLYKFARDGQWNRK
ncbi:hypothetical protein ACFL6S_06540 [Candidatus Poribacteria bacterium]